MTKSVGNKAFVRSAICYSKSFHYYGVFQRLFSLSRMKRSWKYVISCLTHETKGNCKKEYYYLKCTCFCLLICYVGLIATRKS